MSDHMEEVGPYFWIIFFPLVYVVTNLSVECIFQRNIWIVAKLLCIFRAYLNSVIIIRNRQLNSSILSLYENPRTEISADSGIKRRISNTIYLIHHLSYEPLLSETSSSFCNNPQKFHERTILSLSLSSTDFQPQKFPRTRKFAGGLLNEDIPGTRPRRLKGALSMRERFLAFSFLLFFFFLSFLF